MSHTHRIFSEYLRENWAQAWKLCLQRRDTREEFVQVFSRTGHQGNGQAVVVHLVVLYFYGCTYTLYERLTRLLGCPAKITATVVDQTDVEVIFKGTPQVAAEAAQ